MGTFGEWAIKKNLIENWVYWAMVVVGLSCCFLWIYQINITDKNNQNYLDAQARYINASANFAQAQKYLIQSEEISQAARVNLSISNSIMCNVMAGKCIPQNATLNAAVMNTQDYLKDVCGRAPPVCG